MAKKNQIRRQSLKGINQTILRFFKNETTHFVIGLISVILLFICCWHLPLSSLQEQRTKVFWTTSSRVN